MEIQKLIEEIHRSDAYGVILETGCGTAVSGALLEVPDASRTVHETYVPYSSDITKSVNGECRAVSAEMVRSLKTEIAEGRMLNYSSKCNLIYTSSFQVSQDAITHGYINIRYDDIDMLYHVTHIDMLYHVTLPMSLSRKEYVKIISEVGIKLIHSIVFASGSLLGYGANYVDVVCVNGESSIKYTLEALLGHSSDMSFNRRAEYPSPDFSRDHYVMLDVDGSIKRPEDLLRTSDKIAFIRGSFNPLHAGHILQAKKCQEDGYKCVFVVTMNAIDKGSVGMDDIIKRADTINAVGYPVMVCLMPYYVNLHHTILKRCVHLKSVAYAMGLDTISRIAKDYERLANDDIRQKEFVTDFTDTHVDVKFYVFDREYDMPPDARWIMDKNVGILINYSAVPDWVRPLSSTGIRKEIDSILEVMPKEALIKYLS